MFHVHGNTNNNEVPPGDVDGLGTLLKGLAECEDINIYSPKLNDNINYTKTEWVSQRGSPVNYCDWKAKVVLSITSSGVEDY